MATSGFAPLPRMMSFYYVCLPSLCFSNCNLATRRCIQVKLHAATFSAVLAYGTPWPVWCPSGLKCFFAIRGGHAGLVNRTVVTLPVKAARERAYEIVGKRRHWSTRFVVLDLG